MSRSGCLGSKFKMLGSLDAQLLLGFALLAFQSKHNFTGRLGLFVKDGLGLSAVSHLLAVVSALALSKVGRLARFVLCHLVQRMLLALARAVRLAFFGNIHHVFESNCEGQEQVNALE
jgi:hypothetical protein